MKSGPVQRVRETSCLEGLPVRVVRGADPGSAHAPDHGYRYDGVYWVDSYWRQTGTDGFMVCRFRLVKEPELRGDVAADAVDGGGAPAASAVPRVEATILRVVRDTELGRRVKQMYDFCCQVCRTLPLTRAIRTRRTAATGRRRRMP